jgi:hypothetical protein
LSSAEDAPVAAALEIWAAWTGSAWTAAEVPARPRATTAATAAVRRRGAVAVIEGLLGDEESMSKP